MQEKWLPIDGTDGVALVSNRGRVRLKERRRLNSVRLLPPRLVELKVTQYGYHEINLAIEGKWIRERVHRLVAKAFVPGWFEGATVDHLDGNKLNNCPENLEWVTVAENTRRQWQTGLIPVSTGERTSPLN